jgi:hypothetical protein
MSQVRRLLPLGACALLVALPAGVDATVTTSTPGTILPREGAITFTVGGEAQRLALGGPFVRAKWMLGPGRGGRPEDHLFTAFHDRTRSVHHRAGMVWAVHTSNPLDTISGEAIVGRDRLALEPVLSTGFSCVEEPAARRPRLVCRKEIQTAQQMRNTISIAFYAGYADA